MRALAFLKRICFSLDCVALSSQTYRACMRAPQRAKLAEHHFYIPLTDLLEPPPQQGTVELLGGATTQKSNYSEEQLLRRATTQKSYYSEELLPLRASESH